MVNAKPIFTRDFALDVCAQFASGESIDYIAESSGNTREEIEALLNAYHAEMEEAFRRAEEGHKLMPMPGDDAGALERIAAALERMIEILEHIERKGE